MKAKPVKDQRLTGCVEASACCSPTLYAIPLQDLFDCSAILLWIGIPFDGTQLSKQSSCDSRLQKLCAFTIKPDRSIRGFLYLHIAGHACGAQRSDNVAKEHRKRTFSFRLRPS